MGSTTSKSSSILETLNETINDVVSKSSNIIKTTIESRQIIKAKCTEEQLKMATDSYNRLYELWLKYDKVGSEPKQLMCTVQNITQDATISLKADNNSKMKFTNEIKKELTNIAE